MRGFRGFGLETTGVIAAAGADVIVPARDIAKATALSTEFEDGRMMDEVVDGAHEPNDVTVGRSTSSMVSVPCTVPEGAGNWGASASASTLGR